MKAAEPHDARNRLLSQPDPIRKQLLMRAYVRMATGRPSNAAVESAGFEWAAALGPGLGRDKVLRQDPGEIRPIRSYI